MSKILAVIVNWNELTLTRRCVSSLLTQDNSNYDIIIIDNCSREDPSETLRMEFSNVKIIRNKTNLGVAGGRNVGIRYALSHGYSFLLLFDNDALADKNMLQNLQYAASRNPNTGIFGPKIFREDQKNIIWRAGCTSWKLTYLHSSYKLLKPIFNFSEKYTSLRLDPVRGADQEDNGQFDEEKDMAFQIGCAQLIRAEVFNDIGLLDEEFIPYGSEDIDFCARAIRAGWRIRYIPRAFCWHRIGSSFRDEYQRTFYNAKHLLLLARKNLSSSYFFLCFIPDFVFLTVPLMLAKSFFLRRPQRRKAFIDALVWNLKDIFKRGVIITTSTKL